MRHELPKTYNPSDFEDRIYAEWCEKGYFTPAGKAEGRPHFSVVIPPPNVTGQLHMGHALNNTLQDILIRTKRMQGFDTLWVPGTDHAGIATQIKVEESLRKEKGLTRHDIGREAFLGHVWDWKGKYGSRIINQLKKMGSSCDWTREAFTMDERLSAAVKKVFVSLYNKGLVYRGLRITNWCPDCNTALSDAEVEHKDTEGSFWHIRYPIKGGEGYVTVATTRPETMLGDTAVAIAYGDERYKHLVGKTLILPLMNREIPVIEDENVEAGFGTGCVKITPAHDPNDFETGLRHGLESIIVIDGKGKINENGGKYAGMDRYEARRAIVKDLEALGLLVKTEKCVHAVAHCYRCGTVIEPVASRQWFVKMPPLAAPAIKAVKEGEISFIPDRFSKIYLNWMENIRDWCISRQLWWGHRIPAYYCVDCGHMEVSESEVQKCPKCGSDRIEQDGDVLDTWFSSALWPFSTLGWPEDSEDLKRYYPTSVLVTAYDIITFWVSKMIFMGIECREQIPFPHVFIHGLVRDAEGRKMSKSLGNGIDPLDVIEKYGADALRFALATGNSPGNDMRFSDEKIEAARNFANKLWNAARFVLMNLTLEDTGLPDGKLLENEDKWILSKLNKLAGSVSSNIGKYELGVALSQIYDFTWDVFCDWYIELVKPRLSDKGSAGNESAQRVILYVLTTVLKLLHPFMPFITEEIYQSIPHECESIMISAYPEYNEKQNYPGQEAEMERIIELIKAIRARRAEMNVPPSKKAELFIKTDFRESFAGASVFFARLASASKTELVEGYSEEGAVTIVTESATAYIPLSEMIDLEKEKERLKAELAKTREEIARLDKKLSNEGFTAKAPAAVVEGEREKLAGYRTKYESIAAELERIGD